MKMHSLPAPKANSRLNFSAKFFLTALVLFLLQSCKKEKQDEAYTAEQHDPYIESLGVKVTNWLQVKKQESIPEQADKIQQLYDNLDLKKLYTEPLGDTELLIIVPLKETYVSANNKNKGPVNYFLGILNRNAEIRRGNIVQFIQTGNAALKALPKNTFYKLYKDNNPAITGSLSFLGIADDLQYEMSYQDGKFKTFSIKQLKPKATGGRGNGANTLQCWDTYWVTWDENGSARWDYLYSYCEDDCNTTRTVREGTFRTNCGGGGGDPTETEQPVTKVKSWVVGSAQSGLWYVTSSERLDGVKKVSEIGGGHFTAITHSTDAIVGPTDFEWTQPSVIVWLYSGSLAKSHATGIVVNNYNGSKYLLDNETNFIFPAIF